MVAFLCGFVLQYGKCFVGATDDHPYGFAEWEKGRYIDVIFATTPSLRATSPQGEAFCKAPIKGSCRQSRLRGGDRKIGNGRPMIAPTKYKNAQKNTAVSAVSKTYTYWGSKCFKWGSYHNYKRCNIYETNIKDICNFWGDPCLWGRQGHMKKRMVSTVFTQSIN